MNEVISVLKLDVARGRPRSGGDGPGPVFIFISFSYLAAACELEMHLMNPKATCFPVSFEIVASILNSCKLLFNGIFINSMVGLKFNEQDVNVFSDRCRDAGSIACDGIFDNVGLVGNNLII